MTEAARLIGMLKVSAAFNADRDKLINDANSRFANGFKVPRFKVTGPPYKAIPLSLLEGLLYATKHGVPQPSEPLTKEVKVGLDQILFTLNKVIPRDAAFITPSAQFKETTQDLANDLAIQNCRRILAVRSDPKELHVIASTLGLPPLSPFLPLSPAMAGRFPVLSTSNLPRATPEEQSATMSPARGTAMLNSIFKAVRVPEFRFKWLFWAEKGLPKDKPQQSEEYASRPKPLGDQVVSVKDFYEYYHNIPKENLQMRDSIHLFHVGVKPLWEDPRNVRGGAWYFRVPVDLANDFWLEICLLAVGDMLQGAVETKRASFNDEICGVSYSVRWGAIQIAVWNRDAENEAGREKLLAVILEQLSERLRPKKQDSYWYKAHKEHKNFGEQ